MSARALASYPQMCESITKIFSDISKEIIKIKVSKTWLLISFFIQNWYWMSLYCVYCDLNHHFHQYSSVNIFGC